MTRQALQAQSGIGDTLRAPRQARGWSRHGVPPQTVCLRGRSPIWRRDLSGAVRYRCDGCLHDLSPGDTIHFNSTLPHR